MAEYKLAMSMLVIAAFALASIPAAVALGGESDEYDALVTVQGQVTAFTCCDDNRSDDYHDQDDKCMLRAGAFVIDDEIMVEFGPWWYWMVQEVKVTDVVEVDDFVKVTGEMHEYDGVKVLEAWHILNEDTDEEITIKEEGRPPWAGGPKALGIVPWPPSFGDE